MVQQQLCRSEAEVPAVELSIETISSFEEFQRYGAEWDRLVALSGIDHPFMSHMWLSTWWVCFGESSPLRIFVVKEGVEWIAAAPMMIRSVRTCGIPVRRLEPLHNPHTPRCEFPVRCRHHDVYRKLWAAFADPKESWDVVVLQQFVSTSPAPPVFEALSQADGWKTGQWIGPPSPFVRLGCDYEALLNRMKPKERYNLRRRFIKLQDRGEIEMEIIDSQAEVKAAMADGLRIEAAAWKGKAGTAIISDNRVREFYLKLAERAADLGWLKLTFLKVGGQRIAFHLLLDTGNVVYGIKMGYDPEYHSYAPGHTLLTLILKEACEGNRREFDFIGTNDPWKLVWTKDTRVHPWLFIFRNRPLGRLLHYAKFSVLPAVRRSAPLMRIAMQFGVDST